MTTATETPPVEETASTPPPPPGMMEVVMTLDPDGYRTMGADLETVRGKLDLPPSSTPTDVIAAALRELAT
ncbi:MAG TPA: hypothetical protein VHR18_13470 [Solirubrobacterales bacterium]|nr:hypothetical protein [Solirubrobacterales bacterium]